MWQAIRSAAEALLSDDLALANAILEVRRGQESACMATVTSLRFSSSFLLFSYSFLLVLVSYTSHLLFSPPSLLLLFPFFSSSPSPRLHFSPVFFSSLLLLFPFSCSSCPPLLYSYSTLFLLLSSFSSPSLRRGFITFSSPPV